MKTGEPKFIYKKKNGKAEMIAQKNINEEDVALILHYFLVQVVPQKKLDLEYIFTYFCNYCDNDLMERIIRTFIIVYTVKQEMESNSDILQDNTIN